MRFKKLRIFVGIAMVFFILVIGGIISIGLIQKSINNVNNNPNLKILAPIYTIKSTSSNTNSQQQVQVQQPTPIQAPSPIVNTPQIVTRAS